MQLELKQIQNEVGITFIYVTHDQEEALTMSDRIAVMSAGVVQQVGEPRQIYEHPANRFVADFIGETNFVPGVLATPGEPATVRLGDVTVLAMMDGREIGAGEKVTLAVRPEKINLYPQGEVPIAEAGVDERALAHFFDVERTGAAGAGTPSPRGTINMGDYLAREENNVVLPGRVEEAIYIGTDTRYRVNLTDQASIVVRVQNFGSHYDVTFRTGDEVYVHWAAENARVLTE
jgi:spermidine/putrescine transport system ATP-binding protein